MSSNTNNKKLPVHTSPTYYSGQSIHLRDLFEKQELWVFGYGSLMWKTEFPCPFVEKIFGKICGYKRRFWQGSTDHRGTPGKPGRVVTIVEDKESEVWGVAYSFPKESTYEILDLLDYREKGGYDCAMVNFYPIDNRDSFKALLYVGRPVNSSYLGPATLSEMAKQIATAQGPSGANYEYLYNLANALRQISSDIEVKEAHVFELEREVRKLLNEKKK